MAGNGGFSCKTLKLIHESEDRRMQSFEAHTLAEICENGVIKMPANASDVRFNLRLQVRPIERPCCRRNACEFRRRGQDVMAETFVSMGIWAVLYLKKPWVIAAEEQLHLACPSSPAKRLNQRSLCEPEHLVLFHCDWFKGRKPLYAMRLASSTGINYFYFSTNIASIF
ncbi:hypothetical protein B0T21DRAFT_353271 [Apiosordaria backusii]|uniref:Uncharacterized protein n=1 Tax=Apiosordaria backusii TaxID=314023 RepID=A0AA40DI74_9PEZI|nr:hypothetical protein B0T21DRAFT_353271 [Apiosordaria backusii]